MSLKLAGELTRGLHEVGILNHGRLTVLANFADFDRCKKAFAQY